MSEETTANIIKISHDSFNLTPSGTNNKAYIIQGLLSIIHQALSAAQLYPDISLEIEGKIEEIFSLKRKIREDESNWDNDIQILDRKLKELSSQVNSKLSQLQNNFSITESRLCQGKGYEKFPSNEVTQTFYDAGVDTTKFWQLCGTSLKGLKTFSQGQIVLQIRDRFDINDFANLAYRAKEVIAQQLGEETLKLHCTLATIAFRKEEYWDNEITISVSKLLADFGENQRTTRYVAKSDRKELSKPNQYIPKSERLKQIVHQVRLLKRVEVWIPKWRSFKHKQIAVEMSNLWDIFCINEVTQLSATGETKLIDIEITYKPGIWFREFANNENIHDFGYITNEALKLDPVKEEMAFRLAYFALSKTQERESSKYKIKLLLKTIGYADKVEAAKNNSRAAWILKRSFDRGLKKLGKFQHPYRYEFDPDAPEWARPDSKVKKPSGWFDIWLELEGTLNSPDTLPVRKNKTVEPSTTLTPLTASKPAIFGQKIRQAREKRGETQTAMAKAIGISKSKLSQIENGRYPSTISSEVESKILDYLGLYR